MLKVTWLVSTDTGIPNLKSKFATSQGQDLNVCVKCHQSEIIPSLS